MMERLKSCKIRLAKLSQNESGVAAIAFAIFLPVLLGVTALAIDMSYAYWTRTQLQHTASSAALAGASQLADLVDAETASKAEAIVYANLNMDTTRFGTTLLAPDVILGNWDAPTRTFTPMGGLSAVGYACNNPVAQETGGWGNCLWINAVNATTRRAQANGNPVDLFLASAIGMVQTDVNTAAIAWSQGSGEPPPGEENCYQDGMIAGNWVDIQSTNTFQDDFCVYGHCGVAIQSDNPWDETTSIAVGPDNDVAADLCELGTPYMDEQGGNNDGLYDAYYGNAPYGGLQPELALDWTSGNMWSGIEFNTSFAGEVDPLNDLSLVYPIVAVTLGIMAYSPDWDDARDSWEYDPDDGPPACTPGPIDIYYVVSGNADILSYSALCNVAIIADKITSGSDLFMENVMLVARDPSGSAGPAIHDGYTVELGDNATLDHVFIASRHQITFGSYAALGGTPSCETLPRIQLAAMEDIRFESNATISNAQIGAGRDFTMQSDGVLNVTGIGSTVQALRNAEVASNGTFNDCPEVEDEGGEGGDPPPVPGDIVGFDNRLVD